VRARKNKSSHPLVVEIIANEDHRSYSGDVDVPGGSTIETLTSLCSLGSQRSPSPTGQRLELGFEPIRLTFTVYFKFQKISEILQMHIISTQKK
jgi:hypothetical protein